MITLYTTSPIWELPSISPACMKLETWLRMAQLPYKTVAVTTSDFMAAPKGKIPFINYQANLIGDSTLIVEMLKEKEGIDLDAGLTSTERAIALAFRRMLKENTYWGLAYIRYNVEENWQIYRKVIANMLVTESATELEALIDGIGDTFRSQIYAQGMGRHSSEEVFQIISADFRALSDFLADKPFFMGAQPTILDATAYAFIGNTIKPPLKHPVVDYVRQQANLCQHYERMTQQFFSELAPG